MNEAAPKPAEKLESSPSRLLFVRRKRGIPLTMREIYMITPFLLTHADVVFEYSYLDDLEVVPEDIGDSIVFSERNEVTHVAIGDEVVPVEDEQ